MGARGGPRFRADACRRPCVRRGGGRQSGRRPDARRRRLPLRHDRGAGLGGRGVSRPAEWRGLPGTAHLRAAGRRDAQPWRARPRGGRRVLRHDLAGRGRQPRHRVSARDRALRRHGDDVARVRRRRRQPRRRCDSGQRWPAVRHLRRRRDLGHGLSPGHRRNRLPVPPRPAQRLSPHRHAARRQRRPAVWHDRAGRLQRRRHRVPAEPRWRRVRDPRRARGKPGVGPDRSARPGWHSAPVRRRDHGPERGDAVWRHLPAAAQRRGLCPPQRLHGQRRRWRYPAVAPAAWPRRRAVWHHHEREHRLSAGALRHGVPRHPVGASLQSLHLPQGRGRRADGRPRPGAGRHPLRYGPRRRPCRHRPGDGPRRRLRGARSGPRAAGADRPGHQR